MVHKKWGSPKAAKESEKFPEPITTPRLKWKKLFFHSINPSKPNSNNKTQNPPEEFLCPISGSIMADPVIVSSGHSFDRASVQACKDLNFTPQLPDGNTPDFSVVIPNLALKSSILKWCQTQTTTAPNTATTENLVHTLMASKPPPPKDPPVNLFTRAETQVPLRPTHLYTSSEESIATAASSSTPPLQFSTQPSYCYSSPSSSELEPATTPEE
ncbi:U-box domain-containing protein 40-like [Lotus japonicus]|uniref:U-box domain-containing protein 40-like n=1 Tax=Lotus japonicus TaxID=34305 RepID=UPI0025825981|nr:U-box domain-containing protein 40-like [Lotus japonicus]